MTAGTAIEQAIVRARRKYPFCVAGINSYAVKVMRARIRHGFGLPTEGGGSVVATCELELLTRPGWLHFRQQVTVDLGYWNVDGRSLRKRRFTGYVEDDFASAWPQRREVRAVGYLRLAESKTPDDVTYATAPTGDNARDVIAAILEDAGITDVAIAGDDTTLGTQEDVVLGARQTFLSLVQRIDHAHLDVTYDQTGSGRVRRLTITGLPLASPAWDYTYPGEVLEIENPETVRDVRNRVEVQGVDDVAVATRRADSPYVRAGYDEICEVNNDLIQEAADAEAVAAIWMPSVNRITKRVRIRVPGNPLIWAGDTIRLTASTLSNPIDGELLWLGEVDEEFSERGYWMWLTLYGGKGEAGYPVALPIADWTFKIVAETYTVGGVSATRYIVYCDGSASLSPDGSALTYAWTNDQTGDTSSTPYYTIVLTEAELDAPCTVSLTVTNGQGETDTLALELPAHDSAEIEVRLMYLALETDAAASPDGGANWNTSTENATCTPEIAGENHSYFGVGAVLYHTGDYLATAPTAVHTFTGTTINGVWINEVDADSVAAGCADGSVWTTANASSLASATWVKRHQFGAAVQWVVYAWDGIIWALVGSQVIADGAVRWSLDDGYTAKRLALSFMHHYAAGDDGAGNVQVKRDDGVALTFSGATPARLGGLSHHISRDVLFAADDQGRFYRKEEASTVLVYVSDVGGGECYHLVRDGTAPKLAWAACANGLYKCVDTEADHPEWFLERAGKCLMVGYGSAPWGPITPTTVVSADGEGKTSALGQAGTPGQGTGAPPEPPANWRDAAYDDSAWVAAATQTDGATQTFYGDPPTGAAWITCAGGADYGPDGRWLYRHTFALPAGVITSATLTISVDDECFGAWVNNVWVWDKLTETRPMGERTAAVVTIPPAILKPGEDNVLAVWCGDVGTTAGSPSSLGFRLEIA